MEGCSVGMGRCRGKLQGWKAALQPSNEMMPGWDWAMQYRSGPGHITWWRGRKARTNKEIAPTPCCTFIPFFAPAAYSYPGKGTTCHSRYEACVKEVAFVGAVPASGICKGPGRYAGLADKDVCFICIGLCLPICRQCHAAMSHWHGRLPYRVKSSHPPCALRILPCVILEGCRRV